jgi:hypothetical protein
MRRFRTTFSCLSLAFMLPSAALLLAQASGKDAEDTGPKIEAIRHIREGVDAWPLIINPRNDAERKINRYISELNARLLSTLKDCDANYKGAFGGHKLSGEGAEFWSQKVKVTSSGPAYLSLLADTGFYCGGAHPYAYTDAAVFDLRTGDPADPLKWFESSSNASYGTEWMQPDPPLEKSISALGLLAMYRELTKHQCDDVYTDSQAFLIWPDAASGRVMLEADGLGGCCQACGIEVGLTVDEARELGFDEGFLHSVQEAHRQFIATAK